MGACLFRPTASEADQLALPGPRSKRTGSDQTVPKPDT